MKQALAKAKAADTVSRVGSHPVVLMAYRMYGSVRPCAHRCAVLCCALQAAPAGQQQQQQKASEREARLEVRCPAVPRVGAWHGMAWNGTLTWPTLPYGVPHRTRCASYRPA